MSSKSNNLTAENNASSKICERLYCEALTGTAVTYLIGTKEDNGYGTREITEALNMLHKKIPRWSINDIKNLDDATATKIVNENLPPLWHSLKSDLKVHLLNARDELKKCDPTELMNVHFCSDCDNLKCTYDCCTDCKEFFCKKLAGFHPGTGPDEQELLDVLITSLSSSQRRLYNVAVSNRDFDHESFIAFITIVEFSEQSGRGVHLLHPALIVQKISEYVRGLPSARLAFYRTVNDVYKLKCCNNCGDQFCQSCGENKLPSPPCGPGYCSCYNEECPHEEGYVNYEKYVYNSDGGHGKEGCGNCPIPESYVRPDQWPTKAWFLSTGRNEYGGYGDY